MKYYIAVDGGGTKTAALLVGADGTVVRSLVFAPTNPNDVGADTAGRTLGDAVTALADTAAAMGLAIGGAFIGVAGALNHLDELRERVESAAGGRFPVDIDSDASLLLPAAHIENDGAAVVAGTGSACFLRESGVLRRIGGWGYLIDRGGGGFDIGRDLLDAVCREYDGRGPHTTLTDAFRAFTGHDVASALSDIYARGKPYIASFAPLAFEEYERDPEARRIVERNAAAAAELASTALRLHGRPLDIVVGGGLAAHHPLYVDLIRRFTSADKTLPAANIFAADMPNVFGAFASALRADSKISPSVQSKSIFLDSFTEDKNGDKSGDARPFCKRA